MYKSFVLFRLKTSKKKLMKLWDSRGKTDQQVLKAALEVDKWLNEYDKLSKKTIILYSQCYQRKFDICPIDYAKLS